MLPVRPVILCGGSGSRLWPLSSDRLPKQFHSLVGESSLLQQTISRSLTIPGATLPIVITGRTFEATARREAGLAGAPDALIILEPSRKNTAASATLAAKAAIEEDRDAIVVLLPADHYIADDAAFAKAMDDACNLARDGLIVLLGITPDHPNTGFGYIQRGDPLGPGYRVAAFFEKPTLANAEGYLADGRFSWNAGIYVFKASVFLEEVKALAPQIESAVSEAWRTGSRAAAVRFVEKGAWSRCPIQSIDHAVAEKTKVAALIPALFGWNDVGTWASLLQLAAKDGNGNAVIGDVSVADSSNCYLRSYSRPIIVIGATDMIVVESAEGVLVVRRDLAERVKDLVGNRTVRKDGAKEGE